jgi:ubiquinone/menaquinone biosynthesis C-methylase UbiE
MEVMDILLAQKAYENGGNISKLFGEWKNPEDIIQLSYDLQSGTYSKFPEESEENFMINMDYCTQISDIMSQVIDKYNYTDFSVLEAGTGEMTTLSFVVQKIKPKTIYAFDISWSRIYDGMIFAKKYMGDNYSNLNPLVADMNAIPFHDKSINITFTSHALEPNGKKLDVLLKELFRITKDKILLFEPCYEINSEEGKQRMDYYGYIKDVDSAILALGGIIEEKIHFKNCSNPLNPTVCWVISPPQCDIIPETDTVYSYPGTNYTLTKEDNFFFTNDLGMCLPIIKSIPVFLTKNAILASSLRS